MPEWAYGASPRTAVENVNDLGYDESEAGADRDHEPATIGAPLPQYTDPIPFIPATMSHPAEIQGGYTKLSVTNNS